MWKWVKRAVVAGMLLLSGATAVLWVGSYFAVCTLQRNLVFEDTMVAWSVLSVRVQYGGISFERVHVTERCLIPSRPAQIGGIIWRVEINPFIGVTREYAYMEYGSDFYEYWRGAGFQLVRFFPSASSYWPERTCVVVPCWFLLLVTSLYPAIVGFRYMWRRRREGRGFPVEVSEGQAGGCGHSGLR